MAVTLTRKINGTYRTKLKSHTPITIAIPKHLMDSIKRIPRLSLESFKESRGSSTDWYNLTFRIKIALDLAKRYYTDEASEALVDVFEDCLNLYRNFKSTSKWSITEEQYDSILMGLDAMDQIQDETTRRDQLEVFKSSDLYVKKLIEKINRNEDI